MKPKKATFTLEDFEFNRSEKELFGEMEREERTEQEVDAFLGVVFAKMSDGIPS